MRRYNSNLAFVDLLFNLLVGFTSLFVIAFLLINPIAKTGVVDPPVLMIVEMSWADNSSNDIDLYLKGPDDLMVWYANKNNGYATLKRDDIGVQSDTFEVNGVSVTIARNYEVTTMTHLPDGDYVINAHFYSNRTGDNKPEPVTVRITQLQPFKVIFDSEFLLGLHVEKTAMTFRVVDGEIVDIRTDVSVRLRRLNITEERDRMP